MDREKIVNMLGLVPGGDLSITDIQMVQWGHEIIFECFYQTMALNSPDDPVIFRLIFQDCREIKYKVYAHISIHELGEVSPMADVAEMLLGQGNHHRDANILTNHFGITISYGNILIEKDSEVFHLGS